jgi:hypothetical protein
MEKTITKLVKEWEKKYNISPYEINNGNCEEFAYQIVEKIPEACLNYGDDTDDLFFGHVWIEYQEKYYDAECPKGVNKLEDLPIFKKRRRKMKYRCGVNGLLICEKENPIKERCLPCAELDKCKKTHKVLWYSGTGGPVREYFCTSLLEAELSEKEFKELGFKTKIKEV